VAVTGGFTELLNTNTYDGVTTVSGGKLLLGNYTAGSSVFSGMLTGTPWLTVSGTGAFGGNGFVGCTVTNDNGGTLVPGECLRTNSVNDVFPPPIITRTGPLTFGNTPLVLNNGSTTLFNVDNTPNGLNGLGTNASIVGLSSVQYGGTLIVSNLTRLPYTNGQVLKLFSAASYTGAFSSISIPGVVTNGWMDSLVTDGTIVITNAVHSWNPTNIVFSKSGNNLNLSWPADHAGWILQSQTNALNTGFRTTNAWYDAPGSSYITSTNIPIDKTNPTMFFRLRFPN
jgi:autotransporter-associated beta strand protein